jgi:hypothetical protein
MAVTAGTATDHGGHGADHDFRGADHSDPGDIERAAGPGSGAAAAAAAAAVYHQGGRAGQNRQAAAFTCLLRTTMCSVVFLLKFIASMPLQLVPKIAKNITPRDQCEQSFSNSACRGRQTKRSVLILRAVLAAGWRQ